jgi:PKD repeat protein
MRGMGYCYNGDSDDGGSAPGTYGLSPPAVGFDFIGGPLADPNDGIDNDRDSTVDESGERFKMSVFKYDGGDNPSGGQDFYNYLKGWWRDGTPQTYGGSGHNTGLPCSFMFPGLSDPYGWGTNGIPQSPWYDVNLPADRRFLTSVGPFTMSPGEVQYITVAMPWARDTAGDNLDAIIKLQQADDLAQQLFDNCFQLPCSSPTADFTYIASELDVDFFYPYSMALTYSWDFGDGGTSTQKFPQHTYSADGTYNVCLIVTNSCGSDTICKPIKVNVTPEVCGVKLQRMEGQGSGGLFLDLTDSTINEILSSPQHRSLHPIYNAGQGPVFVNITNIDNVIEGNYAIFFDTIAASSRWKMYRIGSTDTVYADSVLGADNTQHIPQWGMSVYVRQCVTPGFLTDPTKGYVGASMTFADHTKQWLTALADKDGFSKDNWIRSGYQADQTGSACLTSYNDYYNADNEENYEGVLGGTWAPYRLCASTNFNNDPNCYTAGPSRGSSNLSLMKNLPNVDLVITPDKSKWSRCPVLEMCDDFNLAIGGARKCFLRRSPSVDKDGQPDNTGTGMGWFPGYAINVETGERLNIMFGEDSWLASENGRDMIWNPTTSVYSPNNVQLYGGRHYIYVMRNSNLPNNVPMYDSGAFIHAYLLGTPSNGNLNDVFSCAAWVNIPLLKPGHSLLETEVRIRLRVARPYSKYVTTPTPQNNNYPLYQFRLYKKELSCYMYEGPDILFPSPFSDQALLQFANPDRKPYQLKIYNLAGQVVQVYDNITDDQVIIRKGQLAAGAYIYSLIAEGEKPRSGKFVVINQ